MNIHFPKSKLVNRIICNNSVHDSSAAVSPNRRWILFMSTRSGDPELWVFELRTIYEYTSFYMSNADDLWNLKSVNRLTHRLGYESGGSFSTDSQKIVYAGSTPKDIGEIESYNRLLRWVVYKTTPFIILSDIFLKPHSPLFPKLQFR